MTLVAPSPTCWSSIPQGAGQLGGGARLLAKEKPGELNFASSGNGTSIRISGELFKAKTGVDMFTFPTRAAARR